jgi:hypothetical protein
MSHSLTNQTDTRRCDLATGYRSCSSFIRSSTDRQVSSCECRGTSSKNTKRCTST